MVLENTFLKVFRFLVRLVGVFWVIGSVVFFVSAFVSPEEKWLFIGIAFFLLLAGLGLLLAKPATSSDTEKVRRFVDQLKRSR